MHRRSCRVARSASRAPLPSLPVPFNYAAFLRGEAMPTLAELAEQRPAWMRDAACAEHPPAWWFPTRGANTTAARSVCRRCLVRDECLEYALADPELAGVWGGLTERDRQRLRAVREVA